MTQDKLKRANELNNTIEQCRKAIAYLDAPGALLRCRHTTPSTATTFDHPREIEEWHNLPLDVLARRVLRDYYKEVWDRSKEEFDNL